MFAFLNTLILSALGLALIPIIIHLLNRKKSVKVPFSSLRFLKILQKKQIKNIKIRQIILLILRTLILLLLVLAFSRPTWRSGSKPAIEAHERTSIIMILDHSMSTGYRTEQGIIFDRIKAKANEILSQCKEGDEIIILAAPGFTETPQTDFSRQVSELKSRIQRIAPVYMKSDISEKMELALELMKKAKNPNREIIVLSDLQKNAFENQAGISDGRYDPSIPVQWLFIGFSPAEYHNVSVDTVRLISRIIEKNKPVTVQVKLSNHSPKVAGDLTVKMFFNGKKVQQQTVSLSAKDAAEIELSALPNATGLVSGWIEIDDDPLLMDNQYYFNFFVPEKIRTLLVQTKPSNYRFIELALSPTPQFQTPVKIETIPSSRWAGINWNDFDILILSNHPSFDDIQIRQMESFLRKGKSVFIIPGSESDAKAYSEGLFRHFNLGVIRSVVDLSVQKEQSVSLGEMNYNHSLLQGIYERNVRTSARNIESPRFYKYWQTDLSNMTSPVIHLSNRFPLMAESRVGAGRILFLTSAVDLTWNDLPLRGIFPPLMHRSLLYLYSSTQSSGTHFLCGYPVEFRLPSQISDQVNIIDTEGHEFKPRIKPLGDETLVSIPGFIQPGYYQVAEKNRNVLLFSVNHHSEESLPQYMKRDDLSPYFNETSFELIGQQEDIADFILTSRLGTELWKWIIGITLFLLIAEMIIAQSHRFEKNKN